MDDVNVKSNTLSGKIICILRALFYPLLFVVSQFLVSFLISFVYSFRLALDNPSYSSAQITRLLEETIESKTNLIVAISDITALLITFLVFVIVRSKKRRRSEDLDFCEWYSVKKVSPYKIVAGVITGVSLNYTLGIILSYLPEDILKTYSEESSSLNSGSMFSYILGVAILAPIAEEVFFRALTVKRLKGAMPGALAVIISAVIFGLGHNGTVWMIYAGILGIVLGFVYERNSSVLASIAVHFGFNAINIYMYALEKYCNIQNEIDAFLNSGLSAVSPENKGALLSYVVYSEIMAFIAIPLSAVGIFYLLYKKKDKKECFNVPASPDSAPCQNTGSDGEKSENGSSKTENKDE